MLEKIQLYIEKNQLTKKLRLQGPYKVKFLTQDKYNKKILNTNEKSR